MSIQSTTNNGLEKALYTDGDNRKNLFDAERLIWAPKKLERVQEQARSVACLMYNWALKEKKDGSHRLISTQPLSKDRGLVPDQKKPLAEGEAFRGEPNPGFGSAFLVASDLILTAGHCITDDNGNLDERGVNNTRVVFEFKMETEKKCRSTFPKGTVFKVVEVVAWALDNQRDFALLRLEESVTGRTPFTCDINREIKCGTRLYMLGHPVGLPIKLTANAEVQDDSSPHHVKANLDAFGGNSGSVTVDRNTGNAVGILVEGLKDWEVRPDGKVIAHHVTLEEIAARRGETVKRISDLPPEVKRLLALTV